MCRPPIVDRVSGECPHGTAGARSFARTCLIATSPSYARFASPGKATPAGTPVTARRARLAAALAAGPRLGLQPSRRGPVAQGIEQQPSKLKVAGSNPAG